MPHSSASRTGEGACLFQHFRREGIEMVEMDLTGGEPVVLDLDRIGQGPGPYAMSFGGDNAALVRSIEAVGLLNPPLVAGNSRGGLDVVAGARRIRALRTLGRNRAPCRDI
ncbi:MAG: ParB N-terminal domain-containing protein, partial [Deltaproteobacteria bacterium]|nr:ParB N-terminal domain-containing protein [Deltaproteobacteria bacterium]